MLIIVILGAEGRDERSMTKTERVQCHIDAQLSNLRAIASKGDIFFGDKAIRLLEYAERNMNIESQRYADLVDTVQAIEDENNEKLKQLGTYTFRSERNDHVAPPLPTSTDE